MLQSGGKSPDVMDLFTICVSTGRPNKVSAQPLKMREGCELRLEDVTVDERMTSNKSSSGTSLNEVKEVEKGTERSSTKYAAGVVSRRW